MPDGDPLVSQEPPAVLHGVHVILRLAVPADAPAFDAIVSEPAVSHWWMRDTWDRIAEERTVVYTIEVNGETAGCIQYAEETDPDYRSAGIDLFVAGRFQEQGIGSDALRTVIEHLIADRGHHRLTIDPAVANVRAVHVYRKLGFREVGVMRRYERGPDGAFRDGLLMELVVDEDGRPVR